MMNKKTISSENGAVRSFNSGRMFIALFLLLCLIPSLGIIAFGPSEAEANEILAELPSLFTSDGKFNTGFLSGLSDWFDDRFWLRSRFSTVWAELNAAVFHTSVEDSVLLGSDGWLYYSDTLDDYTGEVLPEETLDDAARNIDRIRQCCEELGIDFVFTVAPNKNSLYPEHMPSGIPAGETSNVSRLYERLDGLGVRYADLHSVFRAQPETLYFRTDSHWNARGAALAADTVLRALGRESYFFSENFAEGGSHTGDLFAMLYPSGAAGERDHVYVPGFSFTPRSSPRGGEAVRFSTESGSGTGNLLCWRDSFGNSLYPYLAEAFRTADFSRENTYDPEKIRTGKYDTVVIEIVERNISWLAKQQ